VGGDEIRPGKVVAVSSLQRSGSLYWRSREGKLPPHKKSHIWNDPESEIFNLKLALAGRGCPSPDEEGTPNPSITWG